MNAQIRRLKNEHGSLSDARARQAKKEPISQLSTRYRGLSDFTRLLVLDADADYARFNLDRTALADMRQARLLLSDKMERVQRVFLTTGRCCDQPYLASEQKGLIVARFDNAELQAQFPRYNDVPVEQAGRIYVVDPLGNLMMSYAADAPANWLILDIKKLLKLSHIG